jgi:hypothetical protein
MTVKLAVDGRGGASLAEGTGLDALGNELILVRLCSYRPAKSSEADRPAL